MTNQEAIKRIKEHIAIHKYRESHAIHIVEALEMAISALQAQDVPDTNVGDMISRQAAIDAVIKRDANCGIDSAEVLKTLPPVQPKPSACWACNCHKMQLLEKDTTFGKWIPCSERLPDPYFEVIVSDDEIVYTAIRTDIGLNGMREDHYHFEDIEERRIVHPDAWMPLPEPYRGEEK